MYLLTASVFIFASCLIQLFISAADPSKHVGNLQSNERPPKINPDNVGLGDDVWKGRLQSVVAEEHIAYIETFKNVTNSSVIKPACKAYVDEFSNSSSQFIKCSIDNARPFRFCEKCVMYYKKTIEVYKEITKVRKVAPKS